jgi:hypothetical protein
MKLERAQVPQNEVNLFLESFPNYMNKKGFYLMPQPYVLTFDEKRTPSEVLNHKPQYRRAKQK